MSIRLIGTQRSSGMFGEKLLRDQHALIQAGYRYACSLSPNANDAEDLVHDAWIRVSERYGPLPDKSLLLRAIRNRYIDRYRFEQRHRHVPFNEDDPTTYNDPATLDSVLDVDDRHLEKSLARLRDAEREALFLAVVEGYTSSEIAQLMNSPRGTALSLVHRAKLKLRTWLVEESDGSTDLAKKQRAKK